MKKEIFGILKAAGKVAGVAAAGAVVASPDVQQSIISVIPPPYNALAGMGLGVVALWLKSPAEKSEKPKE